MSSQTNSTATQQDETTKSEQIASDPNNGSSYAGRDSWFWDDDNNNLSADTLARILETATLFSPPLGGEEGEWNAVEETAVENNDDNVCPAGVSLTSSERSSGCFSAESDFRPSLYNSDTCVRNTTTHSATRMEEIAPGVEMHFEGTIAATWEAVLDGRVIVVPCSCCNVELHCMDTVQFILCPECSVTSPVDPDHQHGNSVAGSSIGLGFTAEVITVRLQAESS